MSKLGNILENTKLKALTDKTGNTYQFLDQNEKIGQGVKVNYYLWLSRLFVFTAALSLMMFLACSLALFNLAPKVAVEPFLIINQNDSDDIVRYEPIATDMASKEQLMEIFVRQYVIYRNAVIDDEIEMMTRWSPGGIVNFLSDEKVFEAFHDEKELEKKRGSAVNDRISKEVEIVSIGKVGGKKSPVWKVDFKTYEVSQVNRNKENGSLILNERFWTASVTAFFIPYRVFTGRRLINPLGFTVTRYSQSEVEFQ